MDTLINITLPPLSQKLVAYEIRKESTDEYSVYQVVDVTYPHPQAPEVATINVMREDFLKKVGSKDSEYSAIALLYLAQHNLTQWYKYRSC